MTIEKSPPSTEAKPTAATEAKGAKSKSAPAGKTESAGGASGFMAVLAALDVAAAAPETEVDMGAQTVAPQGAQSNILPAIVPDPLDSTQAYLASLNAQADTPLDATSLLLQNAQYASAQTTMDSHALTGADDVARSLGGLNPAAMAGVSHSPFGITGARPNLPADARGAQEALAVEPRRPGKGPLGAVAVMQTKTTAAVSGSEAGASKAMARVAEAPPTLATSLQAPVEVPAMTSAAESTLRRSDEGREGAIFKPHLSEGVVSAAPAQTAPATVLGAGEVRSAVASSTEIYVAEQIKYWISNDVKNAEMTLEGVGSGPVEVSISMKGNEAQVAFRTDEVVTREVLENCTEHLKEMLHKEGVVLTGVSVGTSGAGDSGAQDRRARQGARQVIEVSTNPASLLHGAATVGRNAGRALDVFV
jgi:flagellar hook-length control protein FliK